MLFNLVKKDLIIAKKYLLIMIIFAVAGPTFIAIQSDVLNGSFIGFLVTVLFLEYILFNTVSMTEDKYKGSALLCTTPYTRSTVVKAKYLFIYFIFISSLIAYTIASYVAPLGLQRLTITSIGISFLTINLFFGILLPVQFKFGYEKTRYISFVLVFLTPFLFAPIVQWFQTNHITIDLILLVPQMIQQWLPYLISLLIVFISMILSIRIYSRKDL